MSKAESTAPKQRVIGRPFVKGVSGNPAGRPRGSRQVLSEAFLKDAYQVWQERGLESLRMCAVTSPEKFCSIIAGILPKHAELDVSVDLDVRHQVEAILVDFRRDRVPDKTIQGFMKMLPKMVAADADDA
jgi:hypothetical protein